MRYGKGRKEQTRHKILRAAARLFAAKGFKAASIDEIMRECDLTRGGFYAHFQSKSQLYRNAMTLATQSAARRRVQTEGDWVGKLVDDYLQLDERAFFATDVASTDSGVRAAYANACEALVDRIAKRGRYDDEAVLSAAAMLIGAVAIARTVDSSKWRDRLAAACKHNIKALLDGGEQQSFFWDPPSKAERPRL